MWRTNELELGWRLSKLNHLETSFYLGRNIQTKNGTCGLGQIGPHPFLALHLRHVIIVTALCPCYQGPQCRVFWGFIVHGLRTTVIIDRDFNLSLLEAGFDSPTTPVDSISNLPLDQHRGGWM